MRGRAARTLGPGTTMVLAVALAIASLVPARAQAQAWQPAGSLNGHVLIADRGDVGGCVLLDVWAAWQWLRIGGFVGAGAIPSANDASNRMMMPLGVSVAAELEATELLFFSLRVRGGMWGGATQAEKLTLGPMFGAGAWLGFHLGGGASFTLGLDAWGVIGSEAWREPTDEGGVSASTWVIAPGIGFSWTPEEA